MYDFDTVAFAVPDRVPSRTAIIRRSFCISFRHNILILRLLSDQRISTELILSRIINRLFSLSFRSLPACRTRGAVALLLACSLTSGATVSASTLSGNNAQKVHVFQDTERQLNFDVPILDDFLEPGTAPDGSTSAAAPAQVDATLIPIREWYDPTVTQRALVVLVHGTTQHSGSFDKFAKYLAPHGFHIVSMDMRGHGRWFHENMEGGKEADYKTSSSDLVAVVEQLRVAYPNLPLYCIGESVGAAVTVRAIANARPSLINGMILVSPGTRPCHYQFGMVLHDFARGIVALDKQLDATRYITRYSSDDERVTQEMVSDPLSRTTLSGKEILRTRFFISTTPNNAKRIPETVSMLVVQGADDRIVQPESVKEILDRSPSISKKMVTLPFGHVLLGTSFLKPQVLQSVTSWLVEQSDIYKQHSMVGYNSNRKIPIEGPLAVQ